MKTGLILEGGAMRGMFTCGVLDVWMQAGVRFDGAIGVSAGAVFGCNYKSHQIGRALRYNKRFCADRRYGSFHSLLKTGNLFDTEFCYHTIPTVLDPFDAETYRQDPMEFYVTATDARTGKAVYHLCMKGDEEDITWMRASASMPIVSQVVKIGGYELLDGGVADAVPLRHFQSLGYHRNVVILTQPLHYIKEKNKFLPLARVTLRRYPNMISAIADRHIRYNETIRYIQQEEAEGRVFVVRPPQALHIHSTERHPEELERVYALGQAAGQACLKDLRAYLAK